MSLKSNQHDAGETATSAGAWLKGTCLAVLLSLTLLGLSLAPIWAQTASTLFFGGKVLDDVLGQPVLGTALGINLLLFGIALVGTHVLFGLACLALAKLSSAAWPRVRFSQNAWLLIWFCLATYWALIANAASFPNSSLAAGYADAVAANWHGINALVIATSLFSLATATTLIRSLLLPPRPRLRSYRPWIIATAGIAILGLVVTTQLSLAAPSHHTYQQPHVVIIGIDSLRFDAVERAATMTPHLDDYLKDSIVFADATTPLARTFPSWVSILSGREPVSTGALINLLPRDLIHPGDTLPMQLRRSGYHTIYATDEVRFSNLDESYGFDQMIAPPVGSSDFVIGSIADTPLTNLIVNSRLGELLFPYSYANRAASVTYDPDSFIRKVDRNLHVDRPTFLALHLTLPHWPYTWADARTGTSDNSRGLWPLYRSAVERVDRQFSDVMATLKRHGLLDNAIVIVLSDHGESLGSEEQKDSDFKDYMARESQVGHGTSVFARAQYHVLLSMRFFGKAGKETSPKQRIAAPVSLIDIAPTLTDMLSLSTAAPFDGRSLRPLIEADSPREEAIFFQRIRLTETEFNPTGISPGQTMAGSSLRSAAGYYEVDPITDRVSIKRQNLRSILSDRQFAAFRGEKLLAAIPNRSAPGTWRYLFADGRSKPTPWVPNSPTADTDQLQLWDALRNHLARMPVDEP